MAEIGKLQTLRVVKRVAFGMYLDGQEQGEILLPERDVPETCQPGDQIEVFVYRDSEDRIVATTRTPLVMVGEVALLKVVSVTDIGAFLDWGLPKDVLVPFREQQPRMQTGQSYLVYLYVDEATQRITASSKLDQFLDQQPITFQEDDRVNLVIGDQTDIGYKVIINHAWWGILYHNEIFQPLEKGQRVPGFIKKIREDGKIDCCLQATGYDKVNEAAWIILKLLHQRGGFLPVTDASSPEEIYAVFGISKKTYKKAIGALYKQQHITLEKRGVKLRAT